jgi:hypothetical protein
MIACHPSVQDDCSHVHRYVCLKPETIRHYKRNANRRHRRYLNRVTRTFMHDPDLFDNEPFDAPSLSSWDLC